MALGCEVGRERHSPFAFSHVDYTRSTTLRVGGPLFDPAGHCLIVDAPSVRTKSSPSEYQYVHNTLVL